MLIYSMSVSVDGFIADREGAFGWTAPDEELFRFHLAEVRKLGGFLIGRRLYETMLVWETDPSLRDNELGAAFADVWCAIPKTVFSRTLDSVQGNARLAEASVAEEVAAALEATDKDVEIGGAGLAAQAFELGLVDELRMFRYPIVFGDRRHAVPAAGHRRRSTRPDRDQTVRLARDLRALPASRRSSLSCSGLTPDERTIFAYATAAPSGRACSYSGGLRYPSEECRRTRL
jgi:dihydrofolate reductase